jgi:hypothetical protein
LTSGEWIIDGRGIVERVFTQNDRQAKTPRAFSSCP